VIVAGTWEDRSILDGVGEGEAEGIDSSRVVLSTTGTIKLSVTGARRERGGGNYLLEASAPQR
jgi:hypothetical protein